MTAAEVQYNYFVVLDGEVAVPCTRNRCSGVEFLFEDWSCGVWFSAVLTIGLTQ